MTSVIPYTRKPITDIFTPLDKDINRRECKRTVPMKVLALGLGRTGTASLRSALIELGFKDTYHMMSASVENPPDCLMWMDAFAAKYDGRGKFGRAEWDALLGHCMAVCDWPAVAFAEELIQAYPEAKVILNTRNIDSWYNSTLKTVNWRATDSELRFAERIGDWAATMYAPMIRKFWEVFFHGDFPRHGKRVFQEYSAGIELLVPKENLLKYEITEGWKPLCDFLEIPVPDGKPFPRKNDTADFVKRCKARNRAQIYNVAFRVLVRAVKFLAIAMGMVLFLTKLVKLLP